MLLPFSTPRYAPNFLGEQSKNFSFVRATSKSYATPLEVYLLDKNCDFVIYNLFVYAKKGFHSTEGSVIENINKLH